MPINLNNKEVRDPNQTKEKYERVKNKPIPSLTEFDSNIINQHLADLEIGRNVNGSKGSRGYARLNTIRSRLKALSEIFFKETGKNLVTISEEELIRISSKMRNGKILNSRGKIYKATGDYFQAYKAFWNWYKKIQKKKGKVLDDKTEYLDTKRDKPKFNYLTFEQVKTLADTSKYVYKVMVWFMFDTGIRSPTELLNVKVKDLQKHPKYDYHELNIREETSKTFGRKIKLLLSLDLLLKYIKDTGLESEDFLFDIKPATINKYLKRAGAKLFDMPHLTMYDFRHSSACYWLPRYPTESGMKYRFGWKQTNMIHYYTEFLGMKDTITQEDLVDADEKTAIQKELLELDKKTQIREEEYLADSKSKDKKIDILMEKIEALQRMVVAQEFDKKIIGDVVKRG